VAASSAPSMAVSAIWQAREGNHRTQGDVMGDTGLEPVIACMSSKCSNQDMLPGRQCLTVHVPWTTGLPRRVGFHVELRTYSRDQDRPALNILRAGRRIPSHAVLTAPETPPGAACY